MFKKMAIIFALVGALAWNVSAKEIDGFSHPESVFVIGEDVFVGNVGEKLEPLSKDKDGFISKLDKSGKVVEMKFLSNLHAPKGMNTINGVLYVVDIDVLKGFDLASKKEVLNLPIKGAIFLNDIVVLDNENLLVSDTGTGIIHKVNVKAEKYETFVEVDSKFGGPNGILLDSANNRLITVGYDPNGKAKGSIVGIDLKSKKQSALSEPLGALDGVVWAKNGDLLVSDWGENLQGVVYRLDKQGKIQKLDLPVMKGPADMVSDGENLWIPRMAEGKVLRIPLP